MRSLDLAESAARVAGIAVTAFAWFGSARGAMIGYSNHAGEASGLARRIRAQVVYLIGAVPYFAVAGLLWRDLPLTLGPGIRTLLLVVGSILGAGGAFLYLGGRRALGAMYNVSSALGSEVYQDQQLVTGGLYRFVRHPMYLGLFCSAVGALFVYRTWTFLFVLGTVPLVAIKARREERLLERRFGEAWSTYAARVPGWFPFHRMDKEVEHVDTFAGQTR